MDIHLRGLCTVFLHATVAKLELHIFPCHQAKSLLEQIYPTTEEDDSIQL